jgi:hypothetical protein
MQRKGLPERSLNYSGFSEQVQGYARLSWASSCMEGQSRGLTGRSINYPDILDEWPSGHR